jgi:hypothetical protein
VIILLILVPLACSIDKAGATVPITLHISRIKELDAGVRASTCSPSPGEAEAGRVQVLRIHTETLSQKKMLKIHRPFLNSFITSSA